MGGIRGARAGMAILLAAAGVAGCAHLSPDLGNAGPAPLPLERRKLFGLEGPRGGAIRKEVLVDSSRRLVSRVTLEVPEESGLDRFGFELHEPPYEPSDRRLPAVLVSPILKGRYVEARYVAEALVDAGFIAAIPYQEDELLLTSKAPEDLSSDFLLAVRRSRRVLDTLERFDRVDPTRLGSVGVSLGALKNIVLLAGEPRLRANVIVMGGLDLAWILEHSSERSVERYLRERAAIEGVAEEELRRRCREAFWFHDGTTARAVDGRTVLLVLARFDDDVPIASGGSLREALGLPETRVLPTGHVTILLFLPLLRHWMIDFLRRRLDGAG